MKIEISYEASKSPYTFFINYVKNVGKEQKRSLFSALRQETGQR